MLPTFTIPTTEQNPWEPGKLGGLYFYKNRKITQYGDRNVIAKPTSSLSCLLSPTYFSEQPILPKKMKNQISGMVLSI
jgi:hypothetical protein